MAAVIASYRQTVHAYPSGGGDYEVATVNLGVTAGTTVASALLVDYVLTVAVSISAAAQYAAAAIPPLSGHEVLTASVMVVVLMSMNLRGIRESGLVLRPADLRLHGRHPRHVRSTASSGWRPATCPTWRAPTSSSRRLPGFDGSLTTFALLFLLARAFSSGCAALTGVEAISNGVPAFQRPKSKNAATTLLLLGMIAITMMVSVIVLARQMGLRYVDPHQIERLTRDGEALGAGYDQHTVIAQMARARSSTTSARASTSWSRSPA